MKFMKTLKMMLACLLALSMTAAFAGCAEEMDTDTADGTVESSAVEDAAADEDTDADADAEDEAEAEDADAEDADADVESEESTADADTEDADTEESSVAEPIVHGEYEVEHDEDVQDDCADLIKTYFTAIEDSNFNGYKACLYPYYYDAYDDWLKSNYNYGMETSMEYMHETLMATAGSDNMVITGINLNRLTDEEMAETGADTGFASLDDYLAMYDSLLGETFSTGLKADVDDVFVVSFTMTATVDGEEKTIMDGMSLLMVEKDDTFYIMG